ncbi:hypothetical protein BZA05DRAFT_474281 [Tricharina praecox]|uniref:uncharacterized protein n=1 Tax=Tricharina praecox TaxID=43433 RepID=UPI002220C848|nr:uncharacterized protein BZA05DRAFT_474281 [Tricharina praecox]KAI5850973.1 hypothetical protein BZA05DRAFT_474281 [Tricharina praecox]
MDITASFLLESTPYLTTTQPRSYILIVHSIHRNSYLVYITAIPHIAPTPPMPAQAYPPMSLAPPKPHKDAATDPKTPAPPPALLATQRDPVPPPRDRDAHALSRAAATATTITPRRPHSPPLPQAQQSKKRKLARPPAASAGAPFHAARFPHLPAPPPAASASAAAAVIDPLAATVATYISTTTRRAADITIALKRRAQSYEMIATHERWAEFARGPESARLDLLRAMDDAVQADREIIRVIAAELRDTIEARERLGGIVDRELTGEGKGMGVAMAKGEGAVRKRVVGRRRGWGWGRTTVLIWVLLLMACAVKWYLGLDRL